MNIVVLAIQIGCLALILLGAGLCVWLAYIESAKDRRRHPSRRQPNMRLVSPSPVQAGGAVAAPADLRISSETTKKAA